MKRKIEGNMKTENGKGLTYDREPTSNPQTDDSIIGAIGDIPKCVVPSKVSTVEGILQSANFNGYYKEQAESASNVAEAEEQAKKLPYPKSAFIVIGDQFNKSFFYSTVQGLIVLYLTRQLGLSNDDATIIFHTYLMLTFFLSIPGALIFDSWLGKFKTIVYFSIPFGVGETLITLSTLPVFKSVALILTLSGLAIEALGSGVAVGSITSIGGDQFKLPEQTKQLATYFSLFYFSFNAGSLLAFIVSPILHDDIHCFGAQDCYFLAFGVANVLVIISLIIFALASPLFVKKPPAGNMIALVSKISHNAIATKWKEKGTNPRQHWLDYADKKYDRQLIEDTKVFMRVLVLFLPLPLFWALYEQQGSRWTIQATHLNGDMGSWNIKPDQMQLLSPFLFIVFVPLYEIAFYPILSLFGIRRPLQKITFGGILVGMAFIISGLLELRLEQTYPTLPSAGVAQLRVYNGELCNYSITTNFDALHFDINSLDTYINKSINTESSQGIDIKFQFKGKSGENCATLPDQNCFLKSEKSYYMFLNSKNATHPVICAEDSVAKPSRGHPLVRTLANVNPSRNIQWKNSKGLVEHTQLAYEQNLIEFQSDTYHLFIDNVEIETVKLEVGGVYTILIVEESSNKYRSMVVIVTDPNSVSILWLIPQYVAMNLGQVTFMVTGTAFSYTEAPPSMKTVIQACWYLTRAFGNVIVVIIAEISIFDSQSSEFFLFAGLMLADMIVFMFIAYFYKPNKSVDE